MRRDAYNDYITYETLHDLRPKNGRDVMRDHVDAVKTRLVERSGMGVGNGTLHMWHDPCYMVERLKVTFDASRWTGR